MDVALKEHIYELETRLLKSEVRQSKKELDVLLADDFLELTSSGRRISKQDCFDGLGVPGMAMKELNLHHPSPPK
ncbi:nuclear transport factor 2 family protein [Fictibacillus sp. KU28468]|uniref:nuclear transport factor 2 family protein n=1 Tax=Fictibacillus sp. KU28468 TaxID=2991053 RepID=UPI00223E21D4|nr:nuclear transport factor 2 family protein [Fictibacillus sp. KU28468]UZJ77746.1 nuclear transport factor 2 family protein [Fictibacillus sp. KU28468]